jgi:SSS family solute:Na+ symporter
MTHRPRASRPIRHAEPVAVIRAWSVCFLATIVISLLSRRTKSDEEPRGPVHSLTPGECDAQSAWYKQPGALGVILIIALIALNG